MDGAGIVTLGDLTVAGPGTVIGPWTRSLEGCRGATVEVVRSLLNGADGPLRCFVQTTFDSDMSEAVDVACVVWSSSGAKIFNLTGAPSGEIVGTDAGLGDNLVNNPIGNAFRMKIVADGPLAAPVTISGRLCAR